jgi:two-component sensor histidine kinase
LRREKKTYQKTEGSTDQEESRAASGTGFPEDLDRKQETGRKQETRATEQQGNEQQSNRANGTEQQSNIEQQGNGTE